ncbi:POGZ [Mytilus coruscus]|uniref:POGZ n=1 Tax=Mytilus coruscus TaxID=42192 RepID=A0A6J8A1L0_MYTCO|nr:POGZ [Mytilus coruscus]
MTKASTTTMPVKRNPTRSRRTMGIELFMECTEEALSPSQITAQQVARYQYDQAIAQIRDAHAKARIGKAKIINKVDNVGKVSPQVTQKAAPALKTPSPSGKEPERSSSPDIIFVGETPASKPRQPVQQPQPLTQQQQQQVYKLVSVSQANQGQLGQWMMKPVANVMPQQQQTLNRPVQQVQQVGQQVSGTMGIGYKRPANFQQQDQLAKKKPRRPGEADEYGKKRPFESDESGNWVPLDEYYYGKMEGDPTYGEEKGEFRFKCWYCNKMLYNNVKAMMHIQGHIDSSKQQNIDLSDLTQCKHCYKQFDTPFEMQTHVDKVHMSNTNVLLCRICDRDHESRHALTQHMRQNHNACEMPYTCQLCRFRSSMYSDVVDHFKKKHDSSQHLLCLYCLRAFLVKFVSQGWGTTQTYYGHLLKHQSKAQTKKCGLCRLAFFNSAEVKAHKLKHHGPNQKAVLGTSAHSSKQDQVLIKVPSSSQNQHGVKSLNAPSVSKVLDFGGTSFPGEVHYFNCFECKMSMGTHDHYRKYVECSMCRFATICSIAYANHMMGFHSGQMSSLNLNIPWERRMPKPMYCLCGFSSRYGNKIANHLVFCMKTSCYENRPEPGTECHREDEDEDPRHKPGASLLDALGLVKRRTITPMYQKSAETSPVEDSSPKPSPWDPEYVPPELQGSQKWKTVKLKDTVTPSKQSVFLGISKSKGNCKKTLEMDIKNSEEAGTSHKGDTSDEIEEKLLADDGTDSGDKLENIENQRTESTKDKAEAERKENELLDFDNENDRAESGDENKINEIIGALDEDELLQDENEQVNDKNVTLVKESDSDKEDETNLNESCNENVNLAKNFGDVKSTNDNLESSSDSVKSPTDNLDDKEKSVNLEGNKKDNENIDSEKQAAADENSEVAEESSSEDKLDETEPNEEVDNSKIEDDSEKQLKDESILEKDEIVEESSSESKVDENNVKKNVDNTESEKVNIDESTSQDIEMEDESSSQNKIDKNESENKEVIHSDSENKEVIHSESENKEVIHSQSENKEVVHSELEQKEVIHSQSENKKVIQSESEQTEESRKETADETKTVENESQEPHSSHKLSETGSENKEDNARTKETKSSPNVEESKTSHHQSDDKRYHGSRSHDQRSDSHRSHDNRRSHDDRRSYDDRRSHDRQYHDDRSYHHQGRYDDRNRHRHQDDRGYDRGYHDNRGYNDQRGNRDHYRDDRRHNNRGHYQGRGGYGSGGYHGYR